MELRRLARDLPRIMFILLVWVQTSTIKADGFDDDDDDDDGRRNFALVNGGDDDDNSSEEVTVPPTMSKTAALFSTVAVMKRSPNQNRGKGCIYSMRLCGSDGNFYNSTCSINTPENHHVMLMHNSFCEMGCGKETSASPCPKRVPVCAGVEGNYQIYENECELNRSRCAQYDVQDILSLTPIVTIGNCQIEVNETRLTCDDILRAKCPAGTLDKHRVCDLANKKTYKSICRVLHRRCKKADDTCYHLDTRCEDAEREYSTHDLKSLVKDCSQFIQPSFPVVPLRRHCLVSPSSPCPRCSQTTVPSLPTLPAVIERYSSALDANAMPWITY